MAREREESVSRDKIWVLALASVGSFMVVLDLLVVATALTAIQRDLHASIEGLEWTVNAYTLSFAALLMTSASLGDRYGRRRLFVAGAAAVSAPARAGAVHGGRVRVGVGPGPGERRGVGQRRGGRHARRRRGPGRGVPGLADPGPRADASVAPLRFPRVLRRQRGDLPAQRVDDRGGVLHDPVPAGHSGTGAAGCRVADAAMGHRAVPDRAADRGAGR